MNSAIILFANTGYAATQFLQIVWIAKVYGPDDLAIFGLVIGIFAPITSFMSAGQRFVILTAGALDSSKASVHATLRTVAIVIILATALLYLEYSGRGGIEILGIFLAAAIYRVVDGNLEVETWCAQTARRRVEFLQGSIARVLPIPIACGSAAIFQVELLAFLWTSAAAVFGLYMLGRLRKGLRSPRIPDATHFSLIQLPGAFLTVLPIGMAAGLESLAIVLPRYFLAAQGTLLQAASYVMFTQIAVIFGLIASAKLQADLPGYSTPPGKGSERKMRSAIRYLGMLGLVAIALGVVLNLLPASLISALVGEWFVIDGNELLVILPMVAWIWYGGGYVANVASIATTKSYMLYFALLLLTVLCGGIIVGSVWASNGLHLVLASLALAFSARLAAALLVLFRSH
jgi:hypothetical protein